MTLNRYLFWISLTLILAGPSAAAGKWHEQTYRGANANFEITDEDVRDFAVYGGNLLRIGFAECMFRDLEAPYALNEEAFTHLERILESGERHGVDILIDPHRYPGMIFPWTTFASDEFWKDFKYHDLMIEVWVEIARRFGNRFDSIAGYDLINEPALLNGGDQRPEANLNDLYARTIAAIREYDAHNYIVLASPRFHYGDQEINYNNGISYLKIPDDPNIVIQTHMYYPQDFTHQDFWDREGQLVDYPGEVNGKLWNAEAIFENFREVIIFQKQWNVPILLGEFSATRWTGDHGLRWLRDVIDVAETYGFHWAYHAFRESYVWDPELSVTDREDRTRSGDAKRMMMLKDYFARESTLGANPPLPELEIYVPDID